MDEQRRSTIAAALHQYRETVLQHSLFVLRVLVEGMEADPLPPGVSAPIADDLHVWEFRRYLQGAVPASVTSPRDMLSDDVRAELIRRAELDGVSHRPVNLELREEYFTAVQVRIAEENVEVAEFPPADLEYLCTLVNGITGPGLPLYRESEQFDFVSSIEDDYQQSMVECVAVPILTDQDGGYNEFTDFWKDWEVTVAFKIGGGPRSWGGSCALYCRNEEHEQWKWRYGVHDEDWCSDVYDSVEDFLGFYAHFREEEEDRVSKSIRSVKGMMGKR